MSNNIVETTRLVLVDTVENKNRFWEATLYDNDQVFCRWGRVGNENGQSKTFSGGRNHLEKQKRSKQRKGYVEQKTVNQNAPTTVSQDIFSVAKSQIDISDPVLEKLISKLVRANIHQITANTQITYNNSSGVFSTPLGVVTADGIREAHDILNDIYQCLNKTGTAQFYDIVNKYLMIVPQKVGRSLQNFVDNNFSSKEDVKKQKDLLDALEVSYNTITSQPQVPNKPTVKHEKVFDVSIHLLENKKEYKRLVDNYERTKKSMHHYDNIKVKNIYVVNIKNMSSVFDRRKIGNIQELYHGSSVANILSIMRSGLKISPPSTVKIAGKLFGNGVYGADSSSKSLGYSLGRWGQGRSNDGAWLFVCDFAMGKTQMANSYGGRRYPENGYDSVTALAKNTGLFNNEFIVYKNDQVNVKYLIECEV